MSFAIRRATLADLPMLLDLERSFPGDRLTRGNLRYLLTRARADVWVCTAADALVGNAIVLYRADSPRARLYSLVVAPRARGRGLARTLVETAAAAAAERGCRCMNLEVRGDNIAAIGLYRKLGYRSVRRMAAYYEDGQDGLRFERPLETPAVPRPIAA
ncbi:MAG TPA: N-acetyltransferase [Burkholderiales bacterium]|nr:N-acetyltransferase [Burkholderiales bacterium]